MDKQTSIIFKYLTILVFLFLLIPNIFQEGLFIDGLIYSTTGNNLARGVGSFWNPSFTKTIISNFEGHPPLALYLQSFFFKVLGDGYFVEKIYSFITAVITALLIIVTWGRLYSGKENKKLYWLPVLLWITIPVSFWAYQNNMLENTLGILTLGACLTSLLSLKKGGLLKWNLLFLSALFMVLGFLTKGFPAFFPLAIYGIHYVVYRQKPLLNVLIHTGVVFLSIALILLLIFQDDTARNFIFEYINIQVIDSIKGNKMIDPRYFVIIRLFRELLAPFLLLLFVFCLTFMLKNKEKVFLLYKKEDVKLFLFLFLIGLSASLPIIISSKQMGFYLLPGLPFFVLAISVLITPLISDFCTRKINVQTYQTIRVSFFAGLILILAWAHINSVNPVRDKELIAEVKALGRHIDKGTTINLDEQLFSNWPLIGYLQRYYYINAEGLKISQNKFLLIPKNSSFDSKDYVLELELNTLLLYKKK